MKLEIKRMEDIDIDAHAQLIFESRQNSPLRNEERTIDSIKYEMEQLMHHGDDYIMIIAKSDENGELLGQLSMWIDWGEIGISHPWQPIVHPKVNQEAVAIALIEHSKKLAKTHSKTKLDIWMEPHSDQAKVVQPTYADWYQKAGFALNSEEFFMDTEYSKLRQMEYSIPNGIEVVPMSNISNDEVKDVVHKTFRNSLDEWSIKCTDSQLYGAVVGWLKRNETFDAEASIVFEKGGEIIGYNVMRLFSDFIEIGPIGVIQPYRGMGLGRALILESTSRLSGNPQTIGLSVSTINPIAYGLYSSLGFEKRFTIQIFSWSPE